MECTHFEPRNDGYCVGIASVLWEKAGLHFHFIKLCKKGDSYWVNFPARKMEDGQYKEYYEFKEIDKKRAFLKEVKDAVMKEREIVLNNRNSKISGDFNDEVLF